MSRELQEVMMDLNPADVVGLFFVGSFMVCIVWCVIEMILLMFK